MNTTQLDETLRNARKLARTFGISYEDLTALLRTTFINPGAVLIPKLEALAFDPEAPDNPAKGITLEILRQFYSGALTAQDLVAKVPNHIILNARDYGGDVAGWLTTNRAQITGLILLTLIPGASVNEFASYDLRYADGRNLQSADYVRLYRFVRLREKLGWTIEDTDLALRALFPKMPENPDNGFREFLPRLALALRVRDRLRLKGSTGLVRLFALWADIDTYGPASLYRQLFLPASVQAPAEVFNHIISGSLVASTETFEVQRTALVEAFNLADEDFEPLLRLAQLAPDTSLSLSLSARLSGIISLARRLKIKPAELASRC